MPKCLKLGTQFTNSHLKNQAFKSHQISQGNVKIAQALSHKMLDTVDFSKNYPEKIEG